MVSANIPAKQQHDARVSQSEARFDTLATQPDPPVTVAEEKKARLKYEAALKQAFRETEPIDPEGRVRLRTAEAHRAALDLAKAKLDLARVEYESIRARRQEEVRRGEITFSQRVTIVVAGFAFVQLVVAILNFVEHFSKR